MKIKLTEEMKQQLLQEVNDTEIDYEDLDSYVYDSNPYGVEEELIGDSGSADWDEDEALVAKFDRFIEIIECDGAIEHIDFPEEWDDDGEMTELVLEFLQEEKKKYEWV